DRIETQGEEPGNNSQARIEIRTANNFSQRLFFGTHAILIDLKTYDDLSS
ncbi:unnamed protein product, partial [Rhizophagus irregularis]